MEKVIYTALGLMSGTSLDGVDAAIIETDGVDIFGFGATAERIYSPAIRRELQGQVEYALEWNFEGPPPKYFGLGNAILGAEHDDCVKALLEQATLNSGDVDIIGYHGQTVLHRPPIDGVKGQTCQLGDGQTMANNLNIPVAFDFRTADVAAGGQGAPLAPIYHEALVRYSKLDGKIAVLNLGGVANVTAIVDGKLKWATDCGPANGPLDSWVAHHTGESFDADGVLSMKGEVDHRIIKQWLAGDFFTHPIPRSADRYDFDVLEQMRSMSLEDGAATLAAFSAQAVARDLNIFVADKVIVCGGGRRNPAIMAMLDMHTDAEVISAEHVGWDGDMLEAQAFAYLAVRSLNGLPISFPETTGCPKPMTGGRVVYPSDEIFAVIEGETQVNPLKLGWSEVEAIISRGFIDDVGILNAVTYTLKNNDQSAPKDLDVEALRAKFIPIYQAFLLSKIESAQRQE